MNSFTSKEAALSKRFSGDPLPPIPGIDKALQSIIMKACSYNPEDRFSSATEMLDEFLKLKVGSVGNPTQNETGEVKCGLTGILGRAVKAKHAKQD